MTELTQILNYLAYGMIFALALVLLKNMASQWRAYQAKHINKTEFATRTAIRGFVILACIWGAFAVQKIAPKTTLSVPTVQERLQAAPPKTSAPVVKPVHDVPEKLSQDPAKLQEQIRSDFNKLPNDQAVKP